ncbi:MAG: hypothetical protein ACKVOO_00885 [Burkholderiaceae bacterium]
MDLTQLLLHLTNFFAPALFLALCSPLLGRIFIRKRPLATSFIASAAIQFIVGAVILVAGLLLFGNDGKTATYAALVLGSGAVQWALLRGWRA